MSTLNNRSELISTCRHSNDKRGLIIIFSVLHFSRLGQIMVGRNMTEEQRRRKREKDRERQKERRRNRTEERRNENGYEE